MPVVEQPPLGIMPKWRWLELRVHELTNAITRYVEAGHEPERAVAMSKELMWVLMALADEKEEIAANKKYDEAQRAAIESVL